MPDFYEFFAGGGMARAGLGAEWECLFANDFDHKKSRVYNENWPGSKLKPMDVGMLTTEDVQGVADLAWASFPCQDLSHRGRRLRWTEGRPLWDILAVLAIDARAYGRKPVTPCSSCLKMSAGR